MSAFIDAIVQGAPAPTGGDAYQPAQIDANLAAAGLGGGLGASLGGLGGSSPPATAAGLEKGLAGDDLTAAPKGQGDDAGFREGCVSNAALAPLCTQLTLSSHPAAADRLASPPASPPASLPASSRCRLARPSGARRWIACVLRPREVQAEVDAEIDAEIDDLFGPSSPEDDGEQPLFREGQIPF